MNKLIIIQLIMTVGLFTNCQPQVKDKDDEAIKILIAHKTQIIEAENNLFDSSLKLLSTIEQMDQAFQTNPSSSHQMNAKFDPIIIKGNLAKQQGAKAGYQQDLAKEAYHDDCVKAGVAKEIENLVWETRRQILGLPTFQEEVRERRKALGEDKK